MVLDMKNKTLKSKTRLIYVFVPIVFFAIFVSLFVLGFLQEDIEYSDTENRRLSDFPQVSLSSVSDGRFMTAFESYLSDQFYSRNKIVSFKTDIMRFLGNSEINGVYIGKNGRLYEVQTVFDSDKLRYTVDAMNSFSGKCNIENQYFMLVPNATQIIKKDFPSFLQTEDQTGYIDFIHEKLDDRINCLDVVTPLNEYEKKDELYFLTDHHWTSQAAFCVFEYFARKENISYKKYRYETDVVTNSFSGTLNSSSGIYDNKDSISIVFPSAVKGKFYVNNLEEKQKYTSCFDLQKLNSSNQYEVFFGGNYSRIQIVTDNLNGKNLLVIKDSYANCFVPLLIPYFENIVMIDPRYFVDNIENVLEMTEFTHLLYLYNVNTFLEDSSLCEMLDN